MSRRYTPRDFRKLWPEFKAESWQAWASIEDAAFGMEPADPELVRRVTGRKALPERQVSELWLIAGRGGGKSRFSGRVGTYFATGRDYHRAPGERIYVGLFGPDRKQAAITFRYVRGLFRSVPALEQMIVRETRDSIELNNGVNIEVITASTAAPRGRSYALVIVEEAAFLPSGDSAEPDTELLRAVRPALARVPDSMLIVVSSPYSRRGELWRAYKAHYGKDSDSALVVQADTRTLNPSFDPREIERAYLEDPASAAAEYGAEFRKDVESFVSLEAVEACVVTGRLELPPVAGTTYHAFLDFAGGSGQDSATLAIAHAETHGGQRIAVLDLVREVRPPFSPEQACVGFGADCKPYRIKTARADRYAGDFPAEQMRERDVTVKPSERVKSEIYRELLPLLNSGTLELLDVPRLHTQLTGLERRTARGGRDTIDHAPSGHDDLINAAAGALVLAATRRRKVSMVWGRPQRSEPQPGEPRVWIDGPASRLVTQRDVDAFVAAGSDEEAGLPPVELYTKTSKWLLQQWQLRQRAAS